MMAKTFADSLVLFFSVLAGSAGRIPIDSLTFSVLILASLLAGRIQGSDAASSSPLVPGHMISGLGLGGQSPILCYGGRRRIERFMG